MGRRFRGTEPDEQVGAAAWHAVRPGRSGPTEVKPDRGQARQVPGRSKGSPQAKWLPPVPGTGNAPVARRVISPYTSGSVVNSPSTQVLRLPW